LFVLQQGGYGKFYFMSSMFFLPALHGMIVVGRGGRLLIVDSRVHDGASSRPRSYDAGTKTITINEQRTTHNDVCLLLTRNTNNYNTDAMTANCVKIIAQSKAAKKAAANARKLERREIATWTPLAPHGIRMVLISTE
jgi:hypothetical protein